MKKYIVLLLITALLISGCKKAEIIEPAVDEDIKKENDMPQIPEEWKGKTMAELLGEIGASDNSNDTLVFNDTEEYETVPQEILPAGVKKISLQMYGEQMQFFPNTLTISKGDIVRWVNELDYHDKKAKVSIYAHHNSLFRSPMLAYKEYFEYQFDEKGEYSYGAVPYESYFKKGMIIVK
jgi:plastocyanin